MTTSLITGLNPQQRQAVESDHPRILAIAGAGSGKTACLTRRIARLMTGGVPAERILAVTFTRKAADEMKSRVSSLIEDVMPDYRGGMPTVRTMHSWGAQLLRRFPDRFGLTRHFTIYDEADSESVLRAAAEAVGETSKRSSTLRRREPVMEEYRAMLKAGNAVDFDQIEAMTLELLEYDPAARTAAIGHYAHVLVDEYQDTNLAQVAIVNGLGSASIFIVGDPRQSIYRFRGAVPATIIALAADHDYEVIQLTANYRSDQSIVDLGNKLVKGPTAVLTWEPMTAERAATPHPDIGEGANRVHAFIDSDEPALVAAKLSRLHDLGVAWKDAAVLCRTWAPLRELAAELERRGVPHRFCGGSGDPWETEDGRNIARAIRLAANPADDNLARMLAEWGVMGDAPRFREWATTRALAAKMRWTLLRAMAAGQGDQEWGAIYRVVEGLPDATDLGAAEIARAFIGYLGVREAYRSRSLTARLDLIGAILADLGGTSAAAFRDWWTDRATVDRVRFDVDEVPLMTIHASKGLEFPAVVVMGCRDGLFPSSRKSATQEDKDEDLRVLYVAVTRARDHLLLTCPEHFAGWSGKPLDTRPSPFLVGARVEFRWEATPKGS